MTHEVIRHLLDDYVMGDLDDAARAPVAEHIAACEICHAEVYSLESIRARAHDLPTEIDPPTDAWSNIRSAIERDVAAIDVTGKTSRARWQRPLGIAAALLVVAALSSGGTYLYLRDRGAHAPASSLAQEGTPATLAAFTLQENDFLRNAAILQDLLDQQEGSLAPETVAQLKASLRTIDEAILEARNALARDPANKTLVEMLTATYRQKLDLLKRTTEMTRGS
jgi:hypothetical protein